MAGGRPTKYTDDLRDEICVRMAEGESLRSICRDEKMPALSTVLLWVTEDREGFSVHYARARESQAHTHVDEMMDLRYGLLSGDVDPQAAKVVADMIKWSAARMNKRWFSEKPQPEEGDDTAQPVNVNINVSDARTRD